MSQRYFGPMFKRECACGCGELINHIDLQGRLRSLKKGHIHKLRGGIPKLRGDRHPQWNGGRFKNWSGYWLAYKPDHPFATKDGYVREQRLVMEKHLGRYLTKDEVVHHINGIITDNRIENLEVMTRVNHGKFHSHEYAENVMSKRLCILCNQKTRSGKSPRWYKHNNGYMCQRCYVYTRYHK